MRTKDSQRKPAQQHKQPNSKNKILKYPFNLRKRQKIGLKKGAPTTGAPAKQPEQGYSIIYRLDRLACSGQRQS